MKFISTIVKAIRSVSKIGKLFLIFVETAEFMVQKFEQYYPDESKKV